MSVYIPLKYLTSDNQKDIAKKLHIKDSTFVFNKNAFSGEDNTKCISCLNVVNGMAMLPYRFVCDYFKTTLPNKKIANINGNNECIGGCSGKEERVERELIEPFKMNPNFKLFDYQQEVIDKSINYLETNGTSVFNVYCSFGKTVCAIYLAQYVAEKYKYLTLVTYPRDVIGRSFIGTAKSLTNAKYAIVGESKDDEIYDAQIIFCMNTRLQNLPQAIIDKVGYLIIDEAHMFCTQNYISSLLAFQPMYITALTATYERTDGFHKAMDLIVGTEKIIKISKKPFFAFFFHTEIQPTDVSYTSRGVSMQSIIKSLDLNDERNEIIYKMVMYNLDEKILILTKHIEHVKVLQAEIKKRVEPFGKTVSILCGNVKS